MICTALADSKVWNASPHKAWCSDCASKQIDERAEHFLFVGCNSICMMERLKVSAHTHTHTHTHIYICTIHINIQTLPDLPSSYVPKTEFCILMFSYVCTHARVSAEIWTPAHCNVTATPPVLSPSYILPPFSSPCTFTPATKNSARF